MKVLALFSQLALGALFLVFGLNYFFHFFELPPPSGKEAGDFMKLLHESGYMKVVMGLEIAGGVALLTVRWANLGVLILGPIMVNIWLFHACLEEGGYEIPGLATVLMLIVLVKHWKEWQSTLD